MHKWWYDFPNKQKIWQINCENIHTNPMLYISISIWKVVFKFQSSYWLPLAKLHFRKNAIICILLPLKNTGIKFFMGRHLQTYKMQSLSNLTRYYSWPQNVKCSNKRYFDFQSLNAMRKEKQMIHSFLYVNVTKM